MKNSGTGVERGKNESKSENGEVVRQWSGNWGNSPMFLSDHLLSTGNRFSALSFPSTQNYTEAQIRDQEKSKMSRENTTFFGWCLSTNPDCDKIGAQFGETEPKPVVEH